MHSARPHYPVMPPSSKPGRRARQRLPVQEPPWSARPDAGQYQKYDHLNATNPRKRFLLASMQKMKPLNISPVIQNGPVSPEHVLRYFSSLLNDYEKEEIVNFPEIYYLGRPNHKIVPDYDSEYNYGFDDESNNANLIVGDHLAYRFEILELFGAGAFGQVIRCRDHKTKQDVAVKVIVNTDQMHEQGRIEAQILATVNRTGCRHIVKAFDFFIFRSHICITFEILGMNLFELSEANEYRPLPMRNVRMFAQQMLNGLEMCHRNGVVHCDIKPENVLLVKGSQTLVKVIDFGSSCFVGHQKYEYIQSRFYRAPEVMIGITYGPPMDVWSTALVIIELLIGRPLWPGDDELEELWMIRSLLGDPPTEMVARGNRRSEFFEEDLTLKKIEKEPEPMDLADVLNTNDPYLVDFLMKCLTWDPSKRMNAMTALQHPWIQTREFSLSQPLKDSLLPELSTKRKIYV